MATFANELRGLVGLLTEAGPPTAADLRSYYEARRLAIKKPGPQLERPMWASAAAPEDHFVELSGDVAGARFGDDPRGYGAYVELSVTKGSLDDVEDITGPLSTMQPHRPLYPGAVVHSPLEAMFVRVNAGEHRAAIYVVHDADKVNSVYIQF